MAYVYDPDRELGGRLNTEMVDLDTFDDFDAEDVEWLRSVLNAHATATDSVPAQTILADWANRRRDFVKVMPRDYRRVLAAVAEAKASGTDPEEAIMAAAHG